MKANQQVAGRIIDLFGVIYRNLVRDQSDWVEVGNDSRSATLSVLRRMGECSMTELGRHLRVTNANVTFLVDRLESQGLVSRKPDPADRRKTKVVLTAAGAKAIEAKRALVFERVCGKLDRLKRADREYLLEALPRIMDILQRFYPQESTPAPTRGEKEKKA